MTTISDALDLVAARARQGGSAPAPGDYEQDGLLYCGVCRTPKQGWLEWPADENGLVRRELLPTVCLCERRKDQWEKDRLRRERFERNLKDARSIIGGRPRSLAEKTFVNDIAPDSRISRFCRSYVDHWEDMAKDNQGILFYGSKGTGKSFYAGCIANALAEKQVLTGFTTTASLMQLLSGQWDRDEIIEAVCRFRLLVLDDLGTERDTAYGMETLYHIINERSLTGHPTVITTNLDLADIQSEPDIWRGRIYDRVLGMCPITIRMTGESRRGIMAEEKKQRARQILSARETEATS